MKSAEVWLVEGRRLATEDGFIVDFPQFIRDIQLDALNSAVECAEAYAMTGVPVAEAIRAPMPKETP